MPYHTYTYTFLPTVWAESHDRDILEHHLREQGMDYTYTLDILRRRRAWATTLPAGTFDGNLRAGNATLSEYTTAFTAARGGLGPRSRRPFASRYDPIEAHGRLYHHVEAIRALREYVARPALLNAMYRFLLRAVDDPSLVVPARVPGFIPLEQRRTRFGLKGGSCRGPAWSPTEDDVLRRWYGQRTVGPDAGTHTSLTPAQRERVFAELGGRRPLSSIRQRLIVLNKRLLAEIGIDGIVARTRVAEYMSRVLGERPRMPPVGGQRIRVPLTPEQRAIATARLAHIVVWTAAEDDVVRRYFGLGAGSAPTHPSDTTLANAIAELSALGRQRTLAALRQRAVTLRKRVTVGVTST